MTAYTFGHDELNALANQIKDVLADKLNLPQLDKAVVVIAKPSVFGRFMNLAKGADAEKLSIVVLANPEPKP